MAAPLWITYAWADIDTGDFDYLVDRLAEGGVPATYDKIALVPGQKLWSQIASQISEGGLSGWAYLLTPASLASQACLEELEYALNRVLGGDDPSFPLIGLLHSVPIDEVPAALRVRLCVDLASPSWVEEVKAAIERRAPRVPRGESGDLIVAVHHPYGDDPDQFAVEIRPRFGELRYWRIAYPAGANLIKSGVGPAGGGGVGGSLSEYLDGEVQLLGRPMKFVGAGSALTPGTSAYVVFSGTNPNFMAFSIANQAFEIPSQWMPLEFE